MTFLTQDPAVSCCKGLRNGVQSQAVLWGKRLIGQVLSTTETAQDGEGEGFLQVSEAEEGVPCLVVDK